MAKINNHPASLLLVEGNDDFHVILALCKHFNISVRNLENPNGGIFSVIDCKGIDELFAQIPVRFKSSSSISTIGIIIDADTNLQNRWATLQNILKNLEFDPPVDFPETGLILNTDKINIGVWIMPDNRLDGMLEDFISFLVPQNDKLLPIIKTFLNDIEEQHLNKYSLIHKSKALIHSWLSCQEDPGTPLGLGITKRYLTTDTTTCLLLIDWLTKLFAVTDINPMSDPQA